jgi:pimeloyl-ACP methyl ester carboxylesterase
VQSGFSKGSVAGALTFFPPEPPLYEFERCDKDGNVLDDDEHDENGGMVEAYKDEDGEEKGELAIPTGAAPAVGEQSKKRNETNNNDKKKKTKQKSPAAQLTERAKLLRSRSKERNARDKADAKAGVTYILRLDPRLPNPPSYGAPVEAVKIPSKDGTFIATVVYKVPEDHVTPETKTIIYSHGNATDVGAMYPLQAMLVQSLLCHVVSYDYSGYGESGGVAMEANTYKDIAAVYDYTLKNVAEGVASNIILYGQSVGSGPSCHLACKNDDIGGLILHSPFTSGMRVLTPSRYVFVILCMGLTDFCFSTRYSILYLFSYKVLWHAWIFTQTLIALQKSSAPSWSFTECWTKRWTFLTARLCTMPFRLICVVNHGGSKIAVITI